MINYDLERELVGTFLKEPGLIKDVNCQSEWFIGPLYQEIFVALDILNGEKTSLFEIYNFMTSINEKSHVTFKDLNELASSVVTTSHVLSNVETLHKQYLDVKLIEISRKASESLTDDVKAELKDLMTQIERMAIAKDTGKLESTYEKIEFMLENDGDYGIKTYGNLDFKLGGGLFGGMLVTIGARPGVGKTAFAAVNLVEQAIKHNDNLAVDVFTLEMSKREMVNRYVSMHTQISTFKLRNPNKILKPKEKQAVKDCMKFLKTYNLRIHDKSSTIQDIRSQIKSRVFEHGDKPYMCVIDYLGLIKTKERHKDRRLEIESITRDLKILANELNIVIILLSQLSRGVEHRQDKTPVLSDLRESGSIEQDSNVVAFLHNPDESQQEDIELVIRKNREGSLGILKFRFDGNKMKFEPVYE